MIGIGTDLVELGRFRESLARTPTLVARLFTEAEQRYA
ncbi:MAG: holo-ACP synthase, partial [Acidimicrobiia bacterium]|nr:holo-ACP synthase [Acidimicrobiia bacterium]